MSEDKFEEFLRREAQAYNTPPATAPRDEMWAAIERARTAPPRQVQHGRRVRYAPWIGMAATLLLGVGIGRYAMDRGPASLLQDPAFTVDSRSAGIEAPAADAPSADARVDDAPARDLAQVPDMAPATRTDTDLPVATRDVASVPGTAARDVASTPAGAFDGPGRASSTLSPTYQVASQRHLQRAEALVAVVAAAPRDPMMDSLTSLWARDVLTNTRLLLDSPVGDDPIRRGLLEDLENLLVQLVQRSGPAAAERALIDRTLQRTQLLTRLRTSASGT